MRTATTLVMITLLGLASAQANTAPASGDSRLTGVPMSIAKQPKAAQIHGIGADHVALTGVPMSIAKQPKAAQIHGIGADRVALTGVPMSIAKQPKAAPTTGD